MRRPSLIAASIAGSAMMACTTPLSAAPLAGTWTGDRLNMVVAGDGATLESDCADGRISGAMLPDADGRLEAAGHWNARRPGPQMVDEGAGSGIADNARFSATLAGKTLMLTVTPRDGQPQHFRLVRGTPGKLVRCG